MACQNQSSEMISLADFIKALHRHHEIEFSLNGHQYFAAPQTNPPSQTIYAVLDVVANKWIIEGTIECIISFRFHEEKTLINNFSDFCIEYIL